MKPLSYLLMCSSFLMLGTTIVVEAEAAEKPHVVFVTGDDEYRSEESMPMLAKILKRDYGFKVTVCYSLDQDGNIAPGNQKSISGLEALEDADLMVLFTRYRDLPPEQFQHFLNYVKTGKPIVGFRTATHAFLFRDPKSPYRDWNNKKIAELVGQRWITHHGHFGDGHEHLTKVTIDDASKDHPVLRGVKPYKTYSWLYHVHGGSDGHKLAGNSKPLLTGHSLKSGHEQKGNLEKYPLSNPVAWTKTYAGANGKKGRVFFTTTAHPFDFKDPSVRKLSLNGILWSLGMEDKIPTEGAKADLVGKYEPNNSGTGPKKYKTNQKPEQF
ncbi:MAG: ThuA domain-containing protein [Planctomycetes bacterium]|nr:ThuA domain-containing protein [Planctomycetota bacterium]MCH9726052.1 ThuA domain-containing protein [Planctomycetota bacterium]MCH9777204.1 ThuA domain-containing protein [Planctomycetota bacterium]MCH9790047.1 ThuA domain-containing protein [Planctomycetota bacterium]